MNQLNCYGFKVVNDVIPASWMEPIKLALANEGLLDVTGKAASTMPDKLHLIYQLFVKPLVVEVLGYELPLMEWQASTKPPGFKGDEAPHIDGQGYILRGGTWDRVPGFRLLVAVPLTDVVSELSRGSLLGIAGGHVRVRQFFLDKAELYFHPDGSCRVSQAQVCSKHLTCAMYDEYNRCGLFQMLGAPGSVTLASALAPHMVDKNEGPERTVVYFRLGAFAKPGLAAFAQRPLF